MKFIENFKIYYNHLISAPFYFVFNCFSTRLKLENMANNIKKEPPAWQKDPIHGPKVSILRSSSVARFSTAEQNPENEVCTFFNWTN